MKLLWITIIATLIVSCDKSSEPVLPEDDYKKGGLFIINEGNYSSANSSLSYYYPDSNKVHTEIFYKSNNAPLGDVAQSITFHNDKAFISINNSGHIYVINCSNAEFEGKVENLTSPRKTFIINDHKAYVSDLYSKSIVIFNPDTYKHLGTIEVGKSSEAMVMVENKVFVSNWSGYNQTSLNNTVMVINTENDQLIDSIVVGIEPESMVLDINNKLWVLCSGGFMNDQNPSLWKINPSNYEIENHFVFDDIESNPTDLQINGDGNTLYFLNEGCYKMSIDDNSLPSNVFIESENRNLYSIGINKNTEDIYLSDAGNYNKNGQIYRYNSAGSIITSFEAGIIPGQMEFYW